MTGYRGAISGYSLLISSYRPPVTSCCDIRTTAAAHMMSFSDVIAATLLTFNPQGGQGAAALSIRDSHLAAIQSGDKR